MRSALVAFAALVLAACASSASAAAAAADGAAAAVVPAEEAAWDPKGYVYFCPCMGRFGNQVEYYLGVMRLAKFLDRTLILPPFIEYTKRGGRAFPRFSHYFQVNEVRKYVRAIEAHRFIERFGGADQPWAPANRVAYCWGDERSAGGKPPHCNLKNGQPSTDFWEHQGLGAIGRFEHYALETRFGVWGSNPQLEHTWRSRFPAKSHPVVVFTGAPAALPMEREAYDLQRYFVWSKSLQKRAKAFIRKELAGPHADSPAKWIGVHLRVGSDWKSACGNAVGLKSWMSAVQCLRDGESVTATMCYQTGEQIVYAVKRRVAATGASAVFIATDAEDHIPAMRRAMPSVKFVRYQHPKSGDDEPGMDLVILGEADHFIGNCVSSFTAMVKRARDVRGTPSTFFARGKERVEPNLKGQKQNNNQNNKQKANNKRDEL